MNNYKTKDTNNTEWKGTVRKTELQPPWLRGLLQKRENLRPNGNTHLQKGLEVTFISMKQKLQKPK